MVAPGVTTRDLDALAERRSARGGREPAFKGYHGYPATLCASVNEQVMHGIPSAALLVEGDIISIDMGVKLDGFYGDSAVTVPVGPDRAGGRAAAAGDEESLDGRSRRCGRARGCRTSATRCSSTSRRTASRWCASSSGTGSARSCTRSRRFRTTAPGRGPRLAEGMVLAIEPMVNAGKPAVKVLADGWTAVTKDGSLSAHFEHTVAVTATGCRWC
jgi:methionyl aminopeptidase